MRRIRRHCERTPRAIQSKTGAFEVRLSAGADIKQIQPVCCFLCPYPRTTALPKTRIYNPGTSALLLQKAIFFMLDQAIIDCLIQSASEMLAQRGDGDNHTVAAAIYAGDGLIYSGLNVYHFTGGPCAEITALGRLVSDSGATPLAIVAVADRGRGVLAPCGRCREVLADYCPDIQVVLRTENGVEAVPLTALLPYRYLRAPRPEITRNV